VANLIATHVDAVVHSFSSGISADASSALDHPGISTIHEISEDWHPLELERVLDFGIEVADALNAAHAARIWIRKSSVPQPTLLHKRFGDADAPRITHLNQFRFHARHLVITL
jgi:hypothetical protein